MGIPSPAIGRSVYHGAAVIPSDTNGLDASSWGEASDVNRDRALGADGVVAQLSVVVISPAFDSAIDQSTGVQNPAADRLDPSSSARGETRDRDGGSTARSGAVAQLSVVVIAPAFDPGIHHGAGGEVSSGDRLNASSGARNEASDVNRDRADIAPSFVTDLTRAVTSPTSYTAVNKYAGMAA